MQLETQSPESIVAHSMRRIRAPREHGAFLCVPPLEDAGGLIEANRQRLLDYRTPIGQTTLGKLAEQARGELLEAAVRHTSEYRELGDQYSTAHDQRIVMSGHQPELFHPGVWIKNFALDALADDNNAVGIQLIVDNDIAGRVEVAVPVEPGSVERVVISDAAEPLPYEERQIENAATFDKVGETLTAKIADLVGDPIAQDLWSHAIASRQRQELAGGQANLGLALAESRHQLEHDSGLNTLEVPLSSVCQGQVFRMFTAFVLEGIDAVQPIYNSAIVEYREANNLRSNSHPAPLLTRDAEFFESPFWIWNSARPNRSALFVARQADGFLLRVGKDGPTVELGRSTTCEELAEQLGVLEQDAGYKIRPRAMITTLYARLFLCDLFLHGIGGGKYDVVTNQLAMDIFGCEPPAFMILSATYKLPWGGIPVESDDIRQMDGLLRELWYHPENNLEQVLPENSLQFAELAVDKRSLLSEKPVNASAKQWHDRLEKTNAKMRELLKESREKLVQERNRLTKQQARDKIFFSREFSFCLFSGKTLRSAMSARVQRKNSFAL